MNWNFRQKDNKTETWSATKDGDELEQGRCIRVNPLLSSELSWLIMEFGIISQVTDLVKPPKDSQELPTIYKNSRKLPKKLRKFPKNFKTSVKVLKISGSSQTSADFTDLISINELPTSENVLIVLLFEWKKTLVLWQFALIFINKIYKKSQIRWLPGFRLRVLTR